MTKLKRNLLALVGALALLLTLVSALPTSTQAANLTGGTYTYIINGEEATFTFDPVKRAEGTLLPTEVFQQFGIKIEGATTRNITLSKDDVSVKVTLGTNLANLDGKKFDLTTSPLRLNGRLFLPADLLREFGVEFTLDGNMVVLRSYVGANFVARELPNDEWNSLKYGRNFSAHVKLDSGLTAYTEFVLLTADMINSKNLGMNYGVRARMLSMLETNTLILTKISNTSHKAGGMTTASTYLVDDLRNQYDLKSVMDIGNGLISGKVAPAADRTGVLVFPKVNDRANLVSVFYEPNGMNLGVFTNLE